MKNYLQVLEGIIQSESVGAVVLSSGGGDLEHSIEAMTTLKDAYEPPVLCEIPGKYHAEFKRISDLNDPDLAIAFAEKYGVRLPDEDVKIWCAGMMLHHQGHHEMAQAMYDSVYASNLRRKMHAEFEPKLKEKYGRVKLQENAKKTRNPHHDQAINIARATWGKYPGASFTQMVQNLRTFFNGEVSTDSLKRWIKKAGIRPQPLKERGKSFTLVIPPQA